MEKAIEWIEDLLGYAQEDTTGQAICMLEKCGAGCARRQKAFEGMMQLKQAAVNCHTKADYVSFLRGTLHIDAEEVTDGIILKLHKNKCSCPLSETITTNGEMLCHCTRGHEKSTWSIFFDKQIEVEIVESFLRGGKDCVIKLIV